MKKNLLALALLFPHGWSLRAEDEVPAVLVARTGPLSPEEERAKLKLPPGFSAELVAAEPEIQKPMNLAFDDRGRIWVTTTVEYPFPVKEGQTGRDTIRILEDQDGDGRAETVTIFADGLNIPIGLLPLPGGEGAIVYSIPKLWLLLDRDGDGRCDERRVLLEGFGLRDTHGMINGLRLGLDGWVYSCHGYANDSTVKGRDGSTVRMNSGNIWRFRPDGSSVEQVTHGQVNPFGLCFDPLGDLYSADCHSQPGYLVLRGAYYPSFGKPHDGLGYGPTLMEHDHGSTAISGVVWYAADHFPLEYRGTLFLGNVVTNRINHDRLAQHGSSRKAAIQPDFLVSEDPWFRPVDLRLGPDGALYVADFYNRIIGHYEVPLTHPGRDRERGRIWRIIHGERPRRPLEDFRAAGTGALLAALSRENLEVRTRATHELVRRGDQSVIDGARASLRSEWAWARAHALWVLERLSSLDPLSRSLAARDPEVPVRVHLQHVLAERSEFSEEDRRLAVEALRDPDPFVRRAACDALGRHPDPRNLAPLLELRRVVPAEDGLLLHSVRMALRDQLRRKEIWPGIEGRMPKELDLIADVSLGVRSPESAEFLLRRIGGGGGTGSEPPGGPAGPAQGKGAGPERPAGAEEVEYLARFLPEPSLPALEARLRRAPPADPAARAALLGALERGMEERGGRPSAAMVDHARALAAELLASSEAPHQRAGIDLLRGLRIAGLEPNLAALARARGAAEESRRLSLEALAGVDPPGSVAVLREILADPSEPGGLRDRSAALLGSLDRPEAVEALAAELVTAPTQKALRLGRALSQGRAGSERLLDLVEKGKAPARLLRNREIAEQVSRSGLPGAKHKLEALTAGLPEADEGVERLIAARRRSFAAAKADPVKGAAVFEKTCAPCHRIKERGQKIGPELGGIGLRGPDRLLEDILDPGRNVDKAFTATVVITRDGQVRIGLLRSDEGEVLSLIDSEGKEIRIPKKEVKSREPSPLSPMPSNVAETVSESDLNDLLSFLLLEREKPVEEKK